MKSYPRTDRIADQIQRELAALLRSELKDPRVGLVTITEVVVAPDYSHAKVYVTVLGSEAERDSSLLGLSRAAGFLRAQLSHRLALRAVPALHFVYDSSVEQGIRISQLIDQAMGASAPEPAKPARRARRRAVDKTGDA